MPKHHGMSGTKTYRVWQRMIWRCYGKTRDNYARYGGRGIAVCDRWRHSFAAFLEDVGEQPPGMELDRYPNPDGNYEPGNVRWTTRSQNNRNRRGNHLLTFDGKTQTIAAWAEETGLKFNTISSRIERGMTVEQALTLPAVRGRKYRGRGAVA